jgi:branched-chain amino acid transport system ATP-binding protein
VKNGRHKMLEVNDIDVFHGNIQVLWQVNLRVDKGELVAIVGSNGAGKTTLLRTISGFLHPTRGSIKFFEERIDGLPSYEIAKRGVAHAMEGRRIFPRMTTLENLLMGAYIPTARKRIKDNLEWIYQLFPVLKNRKNQLAGTLSGGEQQMLAIARALMANPNVLLLDEPSSGLAPAILKTLFQAIEKINEEGITVLLVEQNVHIALEICDRSYVLENGRIILEGTGDKMLEMDEIKKAYLSL